MNKVIKLQGLHCAVCAEILQEDLAKIKGVREVSVDFISQSITIDATEEALHKAIRTANRFEKVKVLNEESLVPKRESHFREIFTLASAAVLFVVGILMEIFVPGMPCGATYAVYGAAYLVVGYPVLIYTAKNLAKGKIFDENFLMTVASVGAMILGEAREGAEVMILYQFGEFLQSLAVASSRRSIAELAALRSETANRIKEDGEIECVAPETLRVGERILVKAGERIPADGVIEEGVATLDTSSMTGEFAPKYANVGEEVLSGYINIGENLILRVERAYADGAVAKILELVEHSAAKKSKPEKFITKFAKYYTPVVCILALCLAVFAPLSIGLVTKVYPWAEWVKKSLAMLVISCPCALVVSVPLTYFGGVGAAARRGILVKGSVYLDAAAKMKIVAFDKTGTLTEGEFTIADVCGGAETLPLAAAAEKASSHPLAKAFRNIPSDFIPVKVREIAGMGISCEIDGVEVLVGSAAFLRERKVDFKPAESLSVVVYVAKGGRFVGYIGIDDRIKSNAAAAIETLKSEGIEECVLLTGDTRERAEKTREEIKALDEVYAGLLPDEKSTALERLKERETVGYVGDGINDAPVMTAADCAFSMGKIGSGAAIESSDFVLLSDDLSGVATAVKIAKKTRRIARENMIFSVATKAGFMIAAIAFELPLAAAVFGDVGVMLLAVLNSMRMRTKIK